MDDFLTDEQQADRTKQWLRENGIFLAAGIVLGLGGLFGWQSYEGHQTELSAEAAGVYEQLRSAIDGERYNEVDETLELLAADYASTPYLDQGRLAIAAMHMSRNSPEEAVASLQAVVASGGDPELRRVAELRIAQIQIYLEQYEAALAMLGPDDQSAFVGQFHELRGDVFYARAEYENARDEYRAALDKDSYGVIDRAFVQMKLDNVAGSVAMLADDSSPLLEEAAPAAE